MANEIQPYEAVLGAGAGGPLTAPDPWIRGTGYLSYPGGLVAGAPTGGNKGNGTLNATAIYINGVALSPGNVANYLPLAGGTMTGPIILPADPTSTFQAATKQYVDSKFGAVINIPDAPADGTMYGRLNNAWSGVIDMGHF